MTANHMDLAQNQLKHLEQLVLGSQLSEMERLPLWVDSLAATHGIDENVKFAINLCLEEVVSNVIRHGYSNREGQLLTVNCSSPRTGHFIFTVEDDAAPFNPLEVTVPPADGRQDQSQIGGQGIRLLRGFADTLEYEAKPRGNRLRIGFSNAASGSSNWPQ
ncbi:MAG: ATP-binding protein [Acidobacteriaceae bacterium]|jgi:anti-sigma regulatory factor (Ser/Thr protein kinase)